MGAIRCAVAAAEAVRERLSYDTFRILRDLTTTVFRTDLTAGDTKKATAAQKTVQVDATHELPKAPYHLDRLKQNVVEIITAPLQSDKS